MKKIDLTARKCFVYGTRHLYPGDTFRAPVAEARLLMAVGYSTRVMEPAKPAVVRVVAPADNVDVDALRVEYMLLTGRPSDRRWGPARLKAEVDALKEHSVEPANEIS
jgi:hypothetical protein